MLDKIRAILILKKTFNYINNRRKYKIILYNKKTQKKLGLNIFDYKRISGRYIEKFSHETREYNSYNNNIVFEGNYLNGKRNGEGKEYNEKKELIFTGKYLNGKKWEGIEKQYDEESGMLTFESEYIKGEKNGK